VGVWDFVSTVTLAEATYHLTLYRIISFSK
jgi:hypothetical protein